MSSAASTPCGASSRTRSRSPSPYVVGVGAERARYSWLRSLAVPITVIPRARAICTTAEPTPPAAPLTSNVWPGCDADLGKDPHRGLDRDRVAGGLDRARARREPGAQWLSTANSARVQRPLPNTASPTATPSTPSPSASTTPAASCPVPAGRVSLICSRMAPERSFQSNAVHPGRLYRDPDLAGTGVRHRRPR